MMITAVRRAPNELAAGPAEPLRSVFEEFLEIAVAIGLEPLLRIGSLLLEDATKPEVFFSSNRRIPLECKWHGLQK